MVGGYVACSRARPAHAPGTGRDARPLRLPPPVEAVERVDFALTPAHDALRDKARRFVVDVLQPLEVELERAGGRLPRERGAELRRLAIEAGLAGGELPVEVGGG